MRNRIKGHWSWEDVGILPAKLAPAKTSGAPAPSRGAQGQALPAASGVGLYAPLVVAGGVVAGLALVWVLRSLLGSE